MDLIAEIGINHLGSVNLAKQMITAGTDAGIKLFKFQIYKTEEWGIGGDFEWYDYVNHCQLTAGQYREIKDFCDKKGVTFFASVFGDWSFELAEELDMPMYKIASRSLYDDEGGLSQIAQRIAGTGKPIIASLGFRKQGWGIPEFPNAKILYCVSKYPTMMSDITWPKFGDEVHGFSDHTIGIEAPKMAIDRGAEIIEKHFTLDKSLYGPDQACSASPEEMSLIVQHAQQES